MYLAADESLLVIALPADHDDIQFFILLHVYSFLVLYASPPISSPSQQKKNSAASLVCSFKRRCQQLNKCFCYNTRSHLQVHHHPGPLFFETSIHYTGLPKKGLSQIVRERCISGSRCRS